MVECDRNFTNSSALWEIKVTVWLISLLTVSILPNVGQQEMMWSNILFEVERIRSRDNRLPTRRCYFWKGSGDFETLMQDLQKLIFPGNSHSDTIQSSLGSFIEWFISSRKCSLLIFHHVDGFRTALNSARVFKLIHLFNCFIEATTKERYFLIFLKNVQVFINRSLK